MEIIAEVDDGGLRRVHGGRDHSDAVVRWDGEEVEDIQGSLERLCGLVEGEHGAEYVNYAMIVIIVLELLLRKIIRSWGVDKFESL